MCHKRICPNVRSVCECTIASRQPLYGKFRSQSVWICLEKRPSSRLATVEWVTNKSIVRQFATILLSPGEWWRNQFQSQPTSNNGSSKSFWSDELVNLIWMVSVYNVHASNESLIVFQLKFSHLVFLFSMFAVDICNLHTNDTVFRL